MCTLKYNHKDLPGKRFEKPTNVVSVSVCSQSGKLPLEGCPVYTEVFVKATAPTTTCDVHQTATICTETGNIANEFCPNTEVKIFHALPEKEATNTVWSTKYGEEIMSLPELCVHQASDFVYSD